MSSSSSSLLLLGLWFYFVSFSSLVGIVHVYGTPLVLGQNTSEMHNHNIDWPDSKRATDSRCPDRQNTPGSDLGLHSDPLFGYR